MSPPARWSWGAHSSRLQLAPTVRMFCQQLRLSLAVAASSHRSYVCFYAAQADQDFIHGRCASIHSSLAATEVLSIDGTHPVCLVLT